jgi:hypothetical protein
LQNVSHPDSCCRYRPPGAVAGRRAELKQFLPIVALLNLTAQAVAIVGIAIAIFTGNNNIFSAPEYAFGGDGRTWLHLGAHVVFGTTVGTLIPWLIGSGFLAATRKLIGSNRQIIRSAS